MSSVVPTGFQGVLACFRGFSELGWDALRKSPQPISSTQKLRGLEIQMRIENHHSRTRRCARSFCVGGLHALKRPLPLERGVRRQEGQDLRTRTGPWKTRGKCRKLKHTLQSARLTWTLGTARAVREKEIHWHNELCTAKFVQPECQSYCTVPVSSH